MFKGVSEKLERANYFLNNLETLAEEAGALAHVGGYKFQGMRANLDGFFFEIVSAKDFFSQGINDKYVGLPKDEATHRGKLKRVLRDKNVKNALDVVAKIEGKLYDDKGSWLWKLNNYRNSATHRELLHFQHATNMGCEHPKRYLFEDPEDPSQGPATMEVIPYCVQSLKEMRGFLGGLYSELGI